MFPSIIGWGVIACGAWLTWQALSGRERHTLKDDLLEASDISPEVDASGTDTAAEDVTGVVDHGARKASPRKNKLTPVLLFGILAAYIFLFIPLGYVVSTALFLFAITSLVLKGRLLTRTVFAIAFPTAVYLIFTQLLEIGLPAGFLPF